MGSRLASGVTMLCSSGGMTAFSASATTGDDPATVELTSSVTGEIFDVSVDCSTSGTFSCCSSSPCSCEVAIMFTSKGIFSVAMTSSGCC